MAMLGFTWQEEAFCVQGSKLQRQAQEAGMGLIDISVKILHCSWWEEPPLDRYETPYGKLDWDLYRLYGDWKPAKFPGYSNKLNF
jgi:hypothetical protein